MNHNNDDDVGMDDAILDGIFKRLPSAMDVILGRDYMSAVSMTAPAVDEWLPTPVYRREAGGEWLPTGHVLPEDVPVVDPMDVTWPDGSFKVFPDREERTFTFEVLEEFPAAPDIFKRILDEVHHRRLEESILEELAAIITERGKDAPGLLIIKTPDGQWAMKESEWLKPGSAVLSTLDQPDLMAVAQGDGWLYYRQGPSR